MKIILEQDIGRNLLQRKLKLVLAESCTGGLVSHRITNIPGSSECYLGGVVTYADAAKRNLLGVQTETLERYGAVSRETVIEMARGVRRLFSTVDSSIDNIIGLSVSGIAGPGGGTVDKPVGLVWIGMSAADGEWAWKFLWNGNRIENKQFSAEQVLQLLCDYLLGNIAPQN